MATKPQRHRQCSRNEAASLDEKSLTMTWCCPFCGLPGKRSKEHVWPSWLSAEMHRLARAMHAVPGRQYRVRIGTQFGERTAERLDVVSRQVCKRCNETWMSALENRVKPLILPMLEDFPTSLSATAQQVIATWAAKMSMTLDLSVPRDSRTVIPAQRRELFDTGLPPKQSTVWLGRFAGDEWGMRIYRNGCRVEQEGAPEGFQIYKTVFTINRIAFAVVGDSLPPGWRPCTDSEDLHVARRLWPQRGTAIVWPSSNALSEAALVDWARIRIKGLEQR